MLAKLIISALLGLFNGSLGALAFWVYDVPDAPRMTLIVGLAAFGMSLLLLQLLEDRELRRYKRAEARLPANPQAVIAVNLREAKKLTGSRMYLYPGEIRLVNVDKREPHIQRITPEDLKQAVSASPAELRLELADGRSWQLLSLHTAVLVRHLRMMGCPVHEEAR